MLETMIFLYLTDSSVKMLSPVPEKAEQKKPHTDDFRTVS